MRSNKPAFISKQVPLYYQLETLLANKIQSGSFAVNEQLPTEAELVQQYGVSRITVRQALQRLEESGLIRRAAGRGTFVNDHREFTGTMRLEGSMEDLISLGLATAVKVLKVTTTTATAEAAERLDIPRHSKIVRCVRLRFHHNEPYSHVVNEVPWEIGSRLAPEDWEGSVSRVLQEKLRIPLLEAQQRIRASLADAELAAALQTKIGAPLLSVDRLVLTEARRPVEWVHTHYRSDNFCFTVHINREHAQSEWILHKKKTTSEAS